MSLTKPQAHLWIPFAIGLSCLSLFGGCRTPRRAVQGEGLPTQVKILLAGLDEPDQGKEDWIYELSGCITTLNGKLEKDNKVTFTTIGLKKGLGGCEVRIRTANAGPSYTFSSGEPGVLYLAKDVTLIQDADGALAAYADLQKLYGVNISTDTRFLLKIPVVFPGDESGILVNGLLNNCEPNFTASTTFERTALRSGTLTFTASVPTQVAVSCKSLRIDVDGIAQKYASPPSSPFDFTAKPGSSGELPSVALVAVSKDPTGGKGINVKTSPAAKQCEPNKEIYDTASRTCKPKP